MGVRRKRDQEKRKFGKGEIWKKKNWGKRKIKKSQLGIRLMKNASLAVPGALTCSQPATPHHLQNPKWPPGGPKMADRVWKGVYPEVFGRSKQLSLNKFFDPSTNVIASRPPERRPT